MTQNDTTERSIVHASFTLEREYPVSPERVYAAFATAEAKSAWFGDPESPATGGTFDFRVGGHEANDSEFEGHVFSYDALYLDIVEDSRIVYSYTLDQDGAKLSASLTAVEFEPTAAGTRLTLTEHGAFFDGRDDPAVREQGTSEMLTALGTTLTE